MIFIKDFFGAIATTKLWGVIPLDIVLHFVIGAMIFWFFCQFFKKSILIPLLLVFFIALTKEAFDLGVVMRNQFYLEPFKDIIITMLGALMLLNLSGIQKRRS